MTPAVLNGLLEYTVDIQDFDFRCPNNKPIEYLYHRTHLFHHTHSINPGVKTKNFEPKLCAPDRQDSCSSGQIIFGQDCWF